MNHDNDDEAAGDDQAYVHEVGERIRAIRRQKGLSLQEVEATSGGEFKASVLGAYERGERVISVPRLQRLATVYSVPIEQLLPEVGTKQAKPRESGPYVTIDLQRLEGISGAEAEMLSRYLTMIQVQRQDFNGRVLTIRADDLRALACILGVDVDETIPRLNEMGLAYAI